MIMDTGFSKSGGLQANILTPFDYPTTPCFVDVFALAPISGFLQVLEILEFYCSIFQDWKVLEKGC